jgi:hypothetical protein
VFENEGRYFPRLLVLSTVRKGVTPDRALKAEIVKAGVAPARQKSSSDKSNAALDKRFVGWPRRSRREDGEAPCAGVVDETTGEDRDIP